ncbi:MAG: Gfo/Idh/MocA family protein, partial [Syntrophales bacterium]
MLKIAQLGVGYWGPNILRNLMENKRCSVTAAVDLDPERRDYVHRLYPAIKVTDSTDDVLEDPETDAIVIATPVASHFDLAMKALGAGKHVLVEKP